MTNDSKPRVCTCGHGAADHDRWGKGACTPWLRRESDGVIYVGQCDCKEAAYPRRGVEWTVKS